MVRGGEAGGSEADAGGVDDEATFGAVVLGTEGKDGSGGEDATCAGSAVEGVGGGVVDGVEGGGVVVRRESCVLGEDGQVAGVGWERWPEAFFFEEFFHLSRDHLLADDLSLAAEVCEGPFG